MFGKGQREELEEGEAEVLVRRMRERLGREIERVRGREGEGGVEGLMGGKEGDGGGGIGRGRGGGWKL